MALRGRNGRDGASITVLRNPRGGRLFGGCLHEKHMAESLSAGFRLRFRQCRKPEPQRNGLSAGRVCRKEDSLIGAAICVRKKISVIFVGMGRMISLLLLAAAALSASATPPIGPADEPTAEARTLRVNESAARRTVRHATRAADPEPTRNIYPEPLRNAGLLPLRPADTVPTPARPVLVGMTDTAAYFPLLRGRRVAVLANHTAVAELPGAGVAADSAGRVHLVDLLHGRGFDVRSIFAPEHGFRGDADAGERVPGSTDARTGIAIRSLYDGATRRPSEAAMQSFDVLVADMQDVGLRFYTYHIALLRMMDACAEAGKPVVVLDRPNPNGHLIDGPVLDMRYRSGVGVLPVPVLHGLTMGELARMAAGEGWAAACDLRVIPCRNYTHRTEYILPVAPSPNLPTQRAVYLYPALCPFEGTVVSVGRGTDRPFEAYGHPALRGAPPVFTPRSAPGAKHPPLEGQLCRGADLSTMPLDEARSTGFTLRYVIDACRASALGERFFTPMFEKLVGAGYVREMILAGASEEEIRARWADQIARYREVRRKYVLYPD